MDTPAVSDFLVTLIISCDFVFCPSKAGSEEEITGSCSISIFKVSNSLVFWSSGRISCFGIRTCCRELIRDHLFCIYIYGLFYISNKIIFWIYKPFVFSQIVKLATKLLSTGLLSLTNMTSLTTTIKKVDRESWKTLKEVR